MVSRSNVTFTEGCTIVLPPKQLRARNLSEREHTRGSFSRFCKNALVLPTCPFMLHAIEGRQLCTNYCCSAFNAFLMDVNNLTRKGAPPPFTTLDFQFLPVRPAPAPCPASLACAALASALAAILDSLRSSWGCSR